MYLKFLTDLRLVALLFLQRLLELCITFLVPVGMQTIAMNIILMAFCCKKRQQNTCSKNCRLLNFQHFVDLLHLFTSCLAPMILCLLLCGAVLSVVLVLALYLERVQGLPVVRTSLARAVSNALLFHQVPQSYCMNILIIIAAIPTLLTLEKRSVF